MADKKIYTIRATKCRRCGGILTSEFGLKHGIGETCMKKEKFEEIKNDPNQMTIEQFLKSLEEKKDEK